VIVATATAGTTLADFADRSLGIGYQGGSLILFTSLMAVLGLWYWSKGTVAVTNIRSFKAEMFYWLTIMFSQTLGTALGDWMADNSGLGYEGAAIVFGLALVIVAGLWFYTRLSRTFLFWAAFILTRPLGATLGDFLDKPFSDGGLNLSRPLASLVLLLVLIGCVVMLPQRAGRYPRYQ
jgi:uncharacterized membrane-anchored protein